MQLALTTLVVLVIDQGSKLLVRRGRFDGVRLGPAGSLRLVAGRLWLRQLTGHYPKALSLWVILAGALVIASAAIPSSRVFVGLLLGGSLSNVVESSLHGSVTDFVCLRFWPAFNLADVAITIGALGIGTELLGAVGAIGG